MSELETNKSIFFNITQSLNSSNYDNNDKIFSFSSDKKDAKSCNSESLKSDEKGSKATQETLPVSKPTSVKNDSFAFDLIKKKIEDTTFKAPYKGKNLSSDEEGDMKEKLLGEVNKFLWLIFHDLNLRGMVIFLLIF